MNWQAVSAICALVLAGTGIANYLMLLNIRSAILKVTLELKEWARAEFASAKETERRFDELRARHKETA